MQIISRLPFPSLFFHHWDLNGEEMGVLIVKGSFQIKEGKPARRYLPAQSSILLTDEFYAEPNTSALKQESDLAPFKPKTDLSFTAYARSPEAKLLESWPVRFAIKNKLSYGFHVFGERHWSMADLKHKHHWELSCITPITELPLRYDYAYGGTVNTSEDELMTHAYNPVGRGLLSQYLCFEKDSIPAPQIGLEGELLKLSPEEPLTVCGCGPVTKSFLPRLALAGTFDATWQRERHPRMPIDYSYAYWNAAPLPLQIEPYLLGNERIELVGIRHDPRPYIVELPGVTVDCLVSREGIQDKEKLTLNLDTVHCDVADIDQKKHWVSLTWRLTLSKPDDINEIELFAHQIEEVNPHES